MTDATYYQMKLLLNSDLSTEMKSRCVLLSIRSNFNQVYDKIYLEIKPTFWEVMNS